VATARQYAGQLTQQAIVVARKYGFDPTDSAKHIRVLLRVFTLLLGVIVKVLVDKGVVTDQELAAAFDGVAGDNYPDEPVEPETP
jgi:hypothetical protein